MPGVAERRSGYRLPVSLNAVLYYNSLTLPDCRLRDLGPDGAFILTSGSFVPDRAHVDLVICTPTGREMPRFMARVMRSNEEGVGVLLEPADPLSLRRLADILYTA